MEAMEHQVEGAEQAGQQDDMGTLGIDHLQARKTLLCTD